ncbi:hypothetical protein UY3_03575 [Chelonia mydas]|uniref:Uncharacterized protein n=1 Tax=Chelonia mydas TaxID=8469 RepID=M7BTT9_CHEMY|nr:hypothetical protein UY3_03575 [Chelonia mydas]
MPTDDPARLLQTKVASDYLLSVRWSVPQRVEGSSRKEADTNGRDPGKNSPRPHGRVRWSKCPSELKGQAEKKQTPMDETQERTAAIRMMTALL